MVCNLLRVVLRILVRLVKPHWLCANQVKITVVSKGQAFHKVQPLCLHCYPGPNQINQVGTFCLAFGHTPAGVPPVHQWTVPLFRLEVFLWVDQ